MLRLVNLSEQVVTVGLTATRDTGTPERLYAGDVGTQRGDAGGGEVVLRPDAITDAFAYEYRLVVADGREVRLTTDHLERGYRDREEPPGCVDLQFVVRDPTDDSELWAESRFWQDCETAPGTVVPSTDS
jgi:hypothetical protein